MANGIKYRSLKNYKYQLTDTYEMNIGDVPIKKPVQSSGKWIWLFDDGKIIINKGYSWDGASGPTLDTPSSMRASLIHDALYQLMREGLLEPSFRDPADDLLRDIAIEDGMPRWRAKIWHFAVKNFAFMSVKGR